MAPTKKMASPADEVADAHRRATEKSLLAQRKVITAVVKKYDHSVSHIVKCLQGLGLVDADGFTMVDVEGASELPKSRVATAQAALATKRKADAEERKRGRENPPDDGSEDEIAMDKSIPGKYWTIASLSADLMQQLLATCEPAILSKPNTNAMLARGKPDLNKEELAKVIEIATGWPPSHALTGKLRFYKKLMAEAKRANRERGRRAAMLTPKQGCADNFELYQVKPVDGQYFLAHLFLKLGVSLNDFVPQGADDLYIEDAYSETRALIKSKAHQKLQLSCNAFFPEQRFEYLQDMVSTQEGRVRYEALARLHFGSGLDATRALNNNADDPNIPRPNKKPRTAPPSSSAGVAQPHPIALSPAKPLPYDTGIPGSDSEIALKGEDEEKSEQLFGAAFSSNAKLGKDHPSKAREAEKQSQPDASAEPQKLNMDEGTMVPPPPAKWKL